MTFWTNPERERKAKLNINLSSQQIKHLYFFLHRLILINNMKMFTNNQVEAN